MLYKPQASFFCSQEQPLYAYNLNMLVNKSFNNGLCITLIIVQKWPIHSCSTPLRYLNRAPVNRKGLYTLLEAMGVCVYLESIGMKEWKKKEKERERERERGEERERELEKIRKRKRGKRDGKKKETEKSSGK